MRGFCGWFDHKPGGNGMPTLQRMLSAGGAVDAPGAGTAAADGAAMGVCGAVERPRLVEVDGMLVTLAGHPRLVRNGRHTTDPRAVAQALRERGRDALSDLEGDFALAAWDGARRRGLLAVDRIGVHQLVYGRVADGLAFASTLDMLTQHPQVSRRLSPQALYHYLYYHVCPGPGTVFEGLERVAPGHCVEFTDGAVTSSTYWTMRFVEPSDVQTDALEHEFRTVMQAAVRDAAEGAACGAFLSGGTDSTTVSGMLQAVGGTPAKTFSIGFAAEGYDETEYARIAARHFGFEHHLYYVTPADVVDSVPRIAAAYDQPFGNASAIPTYHCARVAREHGVVRLLAGDGGDELFGGNERYAKQHLLGLYQRMPRALRRGAIEPLLLGSAATPRFAPLRKLRSYVEQARPPMPQRYESYNLLQHLGIDEVLTPEFRASIDPSGPGRLLEEAHAPFAEASLINQMLGIDLRLILADGDLPKVTHMCNLAGVDVAFPMLDERVLEFSSRLPSNMKLRGTQLRWFFKHALRDFLPAEIIAKKKHGFGLPVGHWLVSHKPLYELAADSIASLRPRGIVRPQFVTDLLDRRLHEHPAYYGTMVWILMMLGLWLESRRL
jgi:asparagine synthase (glutamine-hydrolysing)